MSTPNGFSPSSLDVTSEQMRAPQGALDSTDCVDEITRVLLLEDVAVADPGAHSDGDVAERIRCRDVGLGVTDDDCRIVVRDRPADQAGLLEGRIRACCSGFDDLEEWREREHLKLRAQRR